MTDLELVKIILNTSIEELASRLNIEQIANLAVRVFNFPLSEEDLSLGKEEILRYVKVGARIKLVYLDPSYALALLILNSPPYEQYDLMYLVGEEKLDDASLDMLSNRMLGISMSDSPREEKYERILNALKQRILFGGPNLM